jgi:uncharacterized repeat protein (TIGR01451 family)
MRTGRHQARTSRGSLFFGAALAVALGIAQMGTATAQEEPTPPDLQVTKTSDAGGTVGEGDPITYTVTVTNVGGSTAEDVELHDTLPPGMGAPAPFPTFKGEPCVVTSGVVVGGVPQASVQCSEVSLAAGESASLEFDARTNGLCGRIMNTVDVEASNEPAGLTGDNSAQAADQGPACNPDLSLDVQVSPSEGRVGATITYTYTVRNTGETTLYHMTVRDDRVGPLGVIDGFSLAPGATDRFTATAILGANPVTSVATAAGEDLTGHKVTAVDSVTVSVVSAGGDTRGDTGGDSAPGAGGTPFTGAGTSAIAALALLLSGLGGLLLALTRRRSPTLE